MDRDEVRLVTLTGFGGIGKTRLALRAAADIAPRFETGAAFVPLTPLRDADLVPSAIATAIGLRDVPQESLVEALKADLVDRSLLLVVDNFEHVLPAAGLLPDLLGAAPEMKILATSREALRVRAEHEFAVGPLNASDGVHLFADRAAAVRPGFELDATNAEMVARICERLELVPLAIELAAARGPAALARRAARTARSSTRLPRRRRARPPRSPAGTARDDPVELRPARRRRTARVRRARRVRGRLLVARGRAGVVGHQRTRPARARCVARRQEPAACRRARDRAPIPHAVDDRRVRARAARRERRPRSGARPVRGLLPRVQRRRGSAARAAPSSASGSRCSNATASRRTCAARSNGCSAEHRLDEYVEMGWSLWVPAWISGRVEEGRRLAHAALAAPDAMSEQSRARLLMIAGIFDMWEGAHDDAAEHLDAAIAAARELGDDELARLRDARAEHDRRTGRG